jgi:hypothetical protein
MDPPYKKLLNVQNNLILSVCQEDFGCMATNLHAPYKYGNDLISLCYRNFKMLIIIGIFLER